MLQVFVIDVKFFIGSFKTNFSDFPHWIVIYYFDFINIFGHL